MGVCAMMVQPQQWHSHLTDTRQNMDILSKPGTSISHVLTLYDNKILDYDARNGPVTPSIINKYWMVDLAKKNQAMGASGDMRVKLQDESKSQSYKEMLSQYKKESSRVNNTFESPHHILKPAGAAGQIMNTAYEIVRRVNYLEKVSGKSYLMERFQARNAANIISEPNLNIKGFTHDELIEGQRQISDSTTPDPVKPIFGTFEKQMFADSFRYEFGMREKLDSQINVIERVTRQIPGIMEKMVNDDLIAIFNALGGDAIAIDWDARGGNADHYTADAAKDIEDADIFIQDYDGPRVFLAPMDTIRTYRRNVQGLNVTTVESSQKKRTGSMPFNEDLTYFTDNHMNSYSGVVVAKDHFVDLYEGPKIEVSYKNEMTPANMEGRILFHFNGTKQKITNSAKKYTSVGT